MTRLLALLALLLVAGSIAYLVERASVPHRVVDVTVPIPYPQTATCAPVQAQEIAPCGRP